MNVFQHSNSVVRGVASAMKRIKSAMVKKKAKTKGTKLHKKLPMDDDERRGMVVGRPTLSIFV